jgi:hypothetical protein
VRRCARGDQAFIEDELKMQKQLVAVNLRIDPYGSAPGHAEATLYLRRY